MALYAERVSAAQNSIELVRSSLDVDENGVDRQQIRGMLALEPDERLRRMENFLRPLLEIRELNARHSVR